MTDRNETSDQAPKPVEDGPVEDGPVDDGSGPAFDAVLRPHRSLTPRGFVLLMALICSISFAAGLVFVLMGAWPVVGFLGLDVLLVYAAFRLNYFSARAEEHVHLSDGSLIVRRYSATGGMREWAFNVFWVRLEFAEHDDGSCSLALISHGRRLDIAAFLSPAEKADFAAALSNALNAARR